MGTFRTTANEVLEAAVDFTGFGLKDIGEGSTARYASSVDIETADFLG